MDIVTLLYEQAREIAKEGHNGWGNTMVAAAEEIEKLRAAQQSVQRTAVAASQQSSLFTDGNLPSKACGASRRR